MLSQLCDGAPVGTITVFQLFLKIGSGRQKNPPKEIQPRLRKQLQPIRSSFRSEGILPLLCHQKGKCFGEMTYRLQPFEVHSEPWTEEATFGPVLKFFRGPGFFDLK